MAGGGHLSSGTCVFPSQSLSLPLLRHCSSPENPHRGVWGRGSVCVCGVVVVKLRVARDT